MAQDIALLHQHAEVVGFILVPADLQAANEAYLHERTVTRAMAARKARQKLKAKEVLP